jgi:very-short-patch-repair endonuclease
VHRLAGLETYVMHHHNIPVTDLVNTIVDIAPGLARNDLEGAVNEADKRGLIDPETLRAALDDLPPRPGVRILRETLDRRTFVLTESALERYFLPIARRAGLTELPLTGAYLNGHKVDFYWPRLGLVVEVDGLTYHRTPAQQATDRRRDQAHLAAGLTPLRFTHGQIRYESGHVEQVLAEVTNRLLRTRDSWETGLQA